MRKSFKWVTGTFLTFLVTGLLMFSPTFMGSEGEAELWFGQVIVINQSWMREFKDNSLKHKIDTMQKIFRLNARATITVCGSINALKVLDVTASLEGSKYLQSQIQEKKTVCCGKRCRRHNVLYRFKHPEVFDIYEPGNYVREKGETEYYLFKDLDCGAYGYKGIKRLNLMVMPPMESTGEGSVYAVIELLQGMTDNYRRESKDYCSEKESHYIKNHMTSSCRSKPQSLTSTTGNTTRITSSGPPLVYPLMGGGKSNFSQRVFSGFNAVLEKERASSIVWYFSRDFLDFKEECKKAAYKLFNSCLATAYKSFEPEFVKEKVEKLKKRMGNHLCADAVLLQCYNETMTQSDAERRMAAAGKCIESHCFTVEVFEDEFIGDALSLQNEIMKCLKNYKNDLKNCSRRIRCR